MHAGGALLPSRKELPATGHHPSTSASAGATGAAGRSRATAAQAASSSGGRTRARPGAGGRGTAAAERSRIGGVGHGTALVSPSAREGGYPGGLAPDAAGLLMGGGTGGGGEGDGDLTDLDLTIRQVRVGAGVVRIWSLFPPD